MFQQLLTMPEDYSAAFAANTLLDLSASQTDFGSNSPLGASYARDLQTKVSFYKSGKVTNRIYR